MPGALDIHGQAHDSFLNILALLGLNPDFPGIRHILLFNKLHLQLCI